MSIGKKKDEIAEVQEKKSRQGRRQAGRKHLRVPKNSSKNNGVLVFFDPLELFFTGGILVSRNYWNLGCVKIHRIRSLRL